nr:ElyC/SanA/YdcF family protein [uncultured Enterobacter sp.]
MAKKLTIVSIHNTPVERRKAYQQRQQRLNHPTNAKEQRLSEFSGAHVLKTGNELHPSVNNGKDIADIRTAVVMEKLIKEGKALHAENKAAANARDLQNLKDVLALAANNKLATLTQPLTLAIRDGEVSLKASAQFSPKEWLEANDKPGHFLVLNGNNDETYVSLIGALAATSEQLQFITSGFGGHGTTDRHAISISQTEGDNFKNILLQNGVNADRIHVDPYSTNSGQNAINVATIIEKKIQSGEPCHKIIIAGTPAAVFRQTYTYARQLDVPSLKTFTLESFPFSQAEEYTTTADNLATLREYSTTLNYLLNTGFLPADAGLYPVTFFEQALDSFHKLADALEGQSGSAEKYQPEIVAMKSMTPETLARIQENAASEEDKANIRVIDNFFRGLFNPLELSFERRLD